MKKTIRNIIAAVVLTVGGGAGVVAINDPALPADVTAAYTVSAKGAGSPLALLKAHAGTTKFASELGIFDIEHPSAADIAVLKSYMPPAPAGLQCLILLVSDDRAECYTPALAWETYDR